MEFRLNMSNLFIAVRDTNRKPIRGLWQRGDKYYLQVRVPGESAPRKFPLDATSLSEAKAAAELRRTELRKGNVPTRGHKPGLSDFAEKYLQVLEKSERPVKVALLFISRNISSRRHRGGFGSARSQATRAVRRVVCGVPVRLHEVSGRLCGC